MCLLSFVATRVVNIQAGENKPLLLHPPIPPNSSLRFPCPLNFNMNIVSSVFKELDTRQSEIVI